MALLWSYNREVMDSELPKQFTYPFCYSPHALCVEAADAVCRYIESHASVKTELSKGRMLGVLVVKRATGQVCFLSAYSGTIESRAEDFDEVFVPPIYDLRGSDGFFRRREAEITAINQEIRRLESDELYRSLLSEKREMLSASLREQKEYAAAAEERKRNRAARRQTGDLSEAEEAALIRESQHDKASLRRLKAAHRAAELEIDEKIAVFTEEIMRLKCSRREMSEALQEDLFKRFRVLNARGGVSNLIKIFAEAVHQLPPGGTGDCAAPRLLQYAYSRHLHPVAMAEFWYGAADNGSVRKQGDFYTSCEGKCGPLLRYMLQGLDIEVNPMGSTLNDDVRIMHEGEGYLVVSKPAGVLSAPGLSSTVNVPDILEAKYQKPGYVAVNRLDQATSGLMVVAQPGAVYANLQAQFASHTIEKEYVAVVNGEVDNTVKRISLPLSVDYYDRPRQKVDYEHGKEAVTEIVEIKSLGYGKTRLVLRPITGRTHQLRVHCAHPAGLGAAICGDTLYGNIGESGQRLMLHCQSLRFTDPQSGERITIIDKAKF